MHQTTVAKIERGSRPLRVAEAAALARIFGVPALAVFESDGPEDQPEEISELQRQLDEANMRADRAKDSLYRQAETFAYLRGEVEKVAWRMNEAAARRQTKRDDAPET